MLVLEVCILCGHESIWWHVAGGARCFHLCHLGHSGRDQVENLLAWFPVCLSGLNPHEKALSYTPLVTIQLHVVILQYSTTVM